MFPKISPVIYPPNVSVYITFIILIWFQNRQCVIYKENLKNRCIKKKLVLSLCSSSCSPLSLSFSVYVLLLQPKR